MKVIRFACDSCGDLIEEGEHRRATFSHAKTKKLCSDLCLGCFERIMTDASLSRQESILKDVAFKPTGNTRKRVTAKK